MKKLNRPIVRLVNGREVIGSIQLDQCVCDSRRGPDGGVCGNCGNAIPEKKKEKV